MRDRFFRDGLLTLILGAGILLAAGCGPGKQAQSAGNALPVGPPPPEASIPIPALDGGTDTVAQFKGKVVLVNFWATWCQPCNEEIPWLIDMNQKYAPKGLVILGVDWEEEKNVVAPWVMMKSFQVNGQPEMMTYRILLGDQNITDKFGANIGLPTSFLYARSGKKVKTIIGLANKDDLDKSIQLQLNMAAPAAAPAPQETAALPARQNPS